MATQHSRTAAARRRAAAREPMAAGRRRRGPLVAAAAPLLSVQPPRLTALSLAQEAAVIELLAEALLARLAPPQACGSPDLRFPAVDGVMHKAPPSP